MAHARVRFTLRDTRGASYLDFKKLINTLVHVEGSASTIPLAALIEWGLEVKATAQVLTPIDTGNLRASAYVLWGKQAMDNVLSTNITKNGDYLTAKVFRPYKGRKDKLEAVQRQHAEIIEQHRRQLNANKHPTVEIGFTPYYSIFVHERTDLKHKKGGPFFLKKAVFLYLSELGPMIKKWVEKEIAAAAALAMRGG